LSPRSEEVQRFSLRSRRDPDATSNPPARSATILLIEDNAADVGLVREALEEHGVGGDLLVLTDGEKAIHYIALMDSSSALCPDLVILDLNLPRRPGFDVLERMKASSLCAASPILILTSSDTPEERAEATRLGADHYIRKPTRLDDFISLGTIFKGMIRAASA